MIIHDGKLHIFDIFIGSVSGGVMIAGTCDMFTIPFPSLIIGTCSGIISTLTYEYLNIKLEKIGINDVKGIVNSHLIPGFLGNITSIIVVLMLGKEWFCSKLKIQNEYIPFGRSMQYQAIYQFVGLLITLFISGIGGLLCGTLLLILDYLFVIEACLIDKDIFIFAKVESVLETQKEIKVIQGNL